MKISAIILSFFIFFAEYHFTIDRHFCCGELADVKFSLSGKKSSCGMEITDRGSKETSSFDVQCCEDYISEFILTSDFVPESVDNLLKHGIVSRTQFFQEDYFTAEPQIRPADESGDLFQRSGNKQALICVFLI